MNKILTFVCVCGVFFTAGCSKKTEQSAVRAPSTPDAERLKSDSERLQQATNNAAKQREKDAQAAATPSATP